MFGFGKKKQIIKAKFLGIMTGISEGYGIDQSVNETIYDFYSEVFINNYNNIDINLNININNNNSNTKSTSPGLSNGVTGVNHSNNQATKSTDINGIIGNFQIFFDIYISFFYYFKLKPKIKLNKIKIFTKKL